MQWEIPPRPAELAESRLIDAILNGTFPINSTLPAERELAAQLGVTRPTLREALQRLSRDGWVEIHHGRSTRVRDYWREGNLAILGTISRHQESLPQDFVANLLQVRLVMAPTYARQSFERSQEAMTQLLETLVNLPDEVDAFAHADWELHYAMTVLSGNPVFTLILNGFRDLYLAMAQRYFDIPQARQHSRKYYQGLLDAARVSQPARAEALTQRVMEDSLQYWQIATQSHGGDK